MFLYYVNKIVVDVKIIVGQVSFSLFFVEVEFFSQFFFGTVFCLFFFQAVEKRKQLVQKYCKFNQ